MVAGLVGVGEYMRSTHWGAWDNYGAGYVHFAVSNRAIGSISPALRITPDLGRHAVGGDGAFLYWMFWDPEGCSR